MRNKQGTKKKTGDKFKHKPNFKISKQIQLLKLKIQCAGGKAQYTQKKIKLGNQKMEMLKRELQKQKYELETWKLHVSNMCLIRI